MTPVTITLIIIGAILIIVSCFMIDKSSDKLSSDVDLISSSYISSSDVKRKVEDTLQEVSEDTVLKTEDELSKISNEKIIAVNDFSNMVLDKITTNHEEVVFLYNMLNEKENEIKEIISQVDQIKNQQSINRQNVNVDMGESEYDETNKESKSNINNSESKSSRIYKESKSNKIYNDSEETESDIIYDELGLNNNQKILKLHKQGKSIVEIAKELKLGQGEVKLVIDLYR